MKIRSLLLAVGLVMCATAHAEQPDALPEFSGVLQFSAPLVLIDGQSTAFQARVATKGADAQSCQLFGKVWATRQNYQTENRVLVVEQGSVSIACEGKPVRRVFGDFVHSPMDPAWEPTQKAICLRPGARGSCSFYGTQVDAGTYGGWVTWHAITPATNGKRQPKLP